LLFNKTTFVCSFSPALTLLQNYTSNADLQEQELKFEKTDAQEEKEMHREREGERGKGTNSLAHSLARCSLKELENSARENDGEEERRGHLLCRKPAGHDKGRY
jgi:hypothetical protein